MKEYVLNDKIIFATEKAYNLIYKEQGYLPISEKNDNFEEIVESDIVTAINEVSEVPGIAEETSEDMIEADVEDAIDIIEETLEKTSTGKTTKKSKKENE